MSATADDVAGQLERFADAPFIREAASLIRSQAARIEKLEAALTEAAPLAARLNSYADINNEMGRVVQGQVKAACDLHKVISAALERT